MHHNGGHLESEQSLCPFKLLTGFPCPGCGITKALVFLYEGDIIKSLQYHLFALPVVLFCVGIILLLSLELITNKAYFNSILYSQKLAYGLAITLAGYHIVRLVVFVATTSCHEILRQSIWG
jgi:hypothetical protein